MNIYKKKLINNSLRLNSIANYFIELTDKKDFIELHKFIKNKRVDSVSMRYISRMGYSEYSTVSSKFNLRRPK